jgi:multiple sugar transport system permease protein
MAETNLSTPLPKAHAAKAHASKRARYRTTTFYMFLLPWLLGLIFLTIIPILLGFLTSLTNYDGLNIESLKFVGAGNYARAFTRDSEMVNFSLWRTVIWGAFNLPLWLGLSFLMALILNQDVKGKGFFRTLYYLPSVMPAVAAVQMWKIILDKNNGLLNALLSLYQPGTAIGFLSTYALQGMTLIAVWGGLGSGMVIFLAGLQNIPDELVEAAKIDGANGWQIFRHITLPLMTPVIFFQLVVGLIGSFQQLTLPLVLGVVGLTQATVPPRSIYLYMIHTYQQIFVNQRYGYGIALLWLLTIGVVVLTLVLFWSQKFWVYQGDNAEAGEK